MAATVIDSLLITLGFDATGVQNVLQVVDGQLKSVGNIASQFTEGLKEGFDGSADGANELARSAVEAGDALKDVGEKGANAMNQVTQGAGLAEKRVKTLGDRAKFLGKTFGTTLKRALMGWAAPLAGMFAVGTLMKGYASDLTELDALTKKVSLSMEERTRKQKLLSEYSVKDLEQYQKTRKAIEEFTKKMKEAATAIFSSIAPALSWMLERLTKMVNYVKTHQSFFVALFAGIATIIAVKLIPTLKVLSLAASKAMIPFLPWIALVAALALSFNELWVFMQGGDSIIERTLKKFGASEKTIESLRGGLKDFLDILKGWAPVLGKVAIALGVATVAMKLFNLVTALNPMVLIVSAIVSAIVLLGVIIYKTARYIMDNWENIKKKAGEIVDSIKGFFTGLGDSIKQIWEDCKASAIDNWENIKKKAGEVVDSIKGFFTGLGDSIMQIWEDCKASVMGFIDSAKQKFQQFKDFLMGLIPNWLKDLLGIDGGKGISATISEAKDNLGKAISDALPSVDGILDGIKGAGDAVKNFGSGILDGAKGLLGGLFGSGASEGVSPALAAGPVDNSTTVTMGGGIQVYTKATDANGIANEIGGAMERRMAATGNKGVNQ